MVNFKLVIPGNCIVKKNTIKELWYRTDKQGRKFPLAQPILYYTKPYVEWAEQAIQAFTVFKNNLFLNDGKLEDGTVLKLPISEPVVVTSVFFISDNRKVDVSNLIESPNDALIGQVGSFMDKVRTVDGEKIKVHYNHDSYKIIADDNRNIIKNLGGSTIFLDPVSPRTEVFISTFDLSKWKQVMDIWHPGLKVANTLESPQLKLDLGNIFDGIEGLQ